MLFLPRLRRKNEAFFPCLRRRRNCTPETFFCLFFCLGFQPQQKGQNDLRNGWKSVGLIG